MRALKKLCSVRATAYAKRGDPRSSSSITKSIFRHGDDAAPEILGWSWERTLAPGGVSSTEADNI